MKSTKLIPLKAKTGSSILIEVEAKDADGIEPATSGALSQAIDNTVDAAVTKISDIAGSLASLNLPKHVEKAVIELGFQFDSKGTIYVVSSTAAATIKLSLTLRFDA